jgi:hypothetical protein
MHRDPPPVQTDVHNKLEDEAALPPPPPLASTSTQPNPIDPPIHL